MDFDTSTGKGRGKRRPPPGGGRPRMGRDLSVSGHRIRDGPEGEETGGFRIPAGSRKAALVHLALAAWRAGEFALPPGDEEEFIPLPDVPLTVSYP